VVCVSCSLQQCDRKDAWLENRQTLIYWPFCQDSLRKPAPERLTNLDFNEARDDGVAVASAGPYANHLHLDADR